MKRALVLAAAALLSGCDLLLDNPEPEEARLVIEGEAGKQVRIITSTEFVAAIAQNNETRVQLFVADTIIATLPYQRVYPIDEEHRYFVEAARVDSDVDGLRMQVFIDDRKQFDENGMLLDGQPYRFVYAFNQAVTREIVIL